VAEWRPMAGRLGGTPGRLGWRAVCFQRVERARLRLWLGFQRLGLAAGVGLVGRRLRRLRAGCVAGPDRGAAVLLPAAADLRRSAADRAGTAGDRAAAAAGRAGTPDSSATAAAIAAAGFRHRRGRGTAPGGGLPAAAGGGGPAAADRLRAAHLGGALSLDRTAARRLRRSGPLGRAAQLRLARLRRLARRRVARRRLAWWRLARWWLARRRRLAWRGGGGHNR
jgi:hypothetical protein